MSTKDKHHNVYRNTLHKSTQMERQQEVSINSRMDKYIVVYLCNGILLNNEKEQNSDRHNNMDELIDIKLSEKKSAQRSTYYIKKA